MILEFLTDETILMLYNIDSRFSKDPTNEEALKLLTSTFRSQKTHNMSDQFSVSSEEQQSLDEPKIDRIDTN